MRTASHIHEDSKGALATLWSWLRRITPKPAGEADMRDAGPTSRDDVQTSASATVLRFPLRGEALLVRLAELLRRRVGELVPDCERLTLSLSQLPQMRLTIDDNAYVEFDGLRGEFDLVIEAPGGTRMIIQTSDFDAIVKFVLQYVVAQLSDAPGLEAAS